MTQRFGKWQKYLGNGLDILVTDSVFEIRYKYVANDLNILNMASMCGKWLKYLRNGFSMLEMAYEFDKRLKYVGNDVYMFEMP